MISLHICGNLVFLSVYCKDWCRTLLLSEVSYKTCQYTTAKHHHLEGPHLFKGFYLKRLCAHYLNQVKHLKTKCIISRSHLLINLVSLSLMLNLLQKETYSILTRSRWCSNQMVYQWHWMCQKQHLTWSSSSQIQQLWILVKDQNLVNVNHKPIWWSQPLNQIIISSNSIGAMHCFSAELQSFRRILRRIRQTTHSSVNLIGCEECILVRWWKRLKIVRK